MSPPQKRLAAAPPQRGTAVEPAEPDPRRSLGRPSPAESAPSQGAGGPADVWRPLGALIVCCLLGAGVTLLLWPLWSWVEAVTGFESIGHSGPALWLWCFALTTVALFLCWLGWQRHRR